MRTCVGLSIQPEAYHIEVCKFDSMLRIIPDQSKLTSLYGMADV